MRGWILVALGAAGCPAVRNPEYCETNVDCKNGKACNIDTSRCELIVDAALADGAEEPLIARTVQQVRDPATPVDTPVELTDVIVTAVDLYGNRTGEFWVQQPGGGMSSGIKVYGTEMAEVALLAVGDIVDVSGGKKTFFTGASDLSGRREIEIAPIAVQHVIKKGGTATPIVVGMSWELVALHTGMELDAEREKWAGALVRVMSITAVDSPMQIGESTLLQFSVPAFYVQSLLTPFPTGIEAGTCFSSITGVVEYNYNYNIQPRTLADVVIGCP